MKMQLVQGVITEKNAGKYIKSLLLGFDSHLFAYRLKVVKLI